MPADHVMIGDDPKSRSVVTHLGKTHARWVLRQWPVPDQVLTIRLPRPVHPDALEREIHGHVHVVEIGRGRHHEENPLFARAAAAW